MSSEGRYTDAKAWKVNVSIIVLAISTWSFKGGVSVGNVHYETRAIYVDIAINHVDMIALSQANKDTKSIERKRKSIEGL